MYTDKLEPADEVIQRLFDPRYSYKSVHIPKEVKVAYLQHFLESRWTEIVGENLARSCSIEKIDGSDLYICTTNSMLANELYMMQQLFLQKINAYLLGRLVIKKAYFHTGSYINRRNKQQKAEAEVITPSIEYTQCPICGSRMQKGLAMCSICERSQREELRQKLAELLRIQPWLSYENCLAYYKCDKILFTAVKDVLKNYYFERVRCGFANKKESLLAVLFLWEKSPEEITPAMYSNAIEYLRRDQSVSAFGSRLHGKK